MLRASIRSRERVKIDRDAISRNRGPVGQHLIRDRWGGSTYLLLRVRLSLVKQSARVDNE